MTVTGVVTGARVTHDDSDVDVLATASPESETDGVVRLLECQDVEEAFVLSTCNRVEAYVVTADPSAAAPALREFFSAVDPATVRGSTHEESLEHLLSVAAGLESVVIGEDQILGQLRNAYEAARSVGGIGDLLESVVTKAIHVGERTRTETAINEGIVSLGSAATALAATELELEGASGLVVGAGEMGRLAARSLAADGVDDIVVANRTLSSASHLVSDLEPEVDARACSLDDLEVITPTADVIITATGSPEPVIDTTHFATTNSNQATDRSSETGQTEAASVSETVIVDLGQPRDVDPAIDSIPSVSVYDLDDIETITEETRHQRIDAAREARAIVDHEFELLCDHLKRTRADDVIAAMYESADMIKQRELETALSRLEADGLSEEQRVIVETMADSLVGQLLAPPTKSLRDAAGDDDWQTIHTALQLFDPEFSPETAPPEIDRSSIESQRPFAESIDD